MFFWVAYAGGSTETIYGYGTTPSTPYRHVANYTTQPGKMPVALYFYAAASWLFPPFQVDIDTISAVPAASSPLVPTGLGPTPYAFTDTFTASLEGWTTVSAANTATLTNPS